MAKKLNVRLTQVEIDHLLILLTHNVENQEPYWGNKRQYWNRTTRIFLALGEASGIQKGT